MKISIVIPVYNSQNNLKELHQRLISSITNIADEYEIIMVEDCGADDSWQIICELSNEDRRVKGIQLSRNFGQHNAILCGVRAAAGDIIITMDDDLQHPPEEIPKLLYKLNEGFDVVYGVPEKEKHGLFRSLASKTTKIALQNTMGADAASNVSAFRVFHSDIRKAFEDYDGMLFSIDVLLTWGTSRFGAVNVRHDERKAGKSNYTIRKLITHAVNMITGFSTLPLQIASLIGFAFTLFGMIVLGYVLIKYVVQGTNMPGFPFLASIIAIFSGAQLFCLGIIGEYLSRVHFRTIKRPTYLVRSTTFEIAESKRTPSETL